MKYTLLAHYKYNNHEVMSSEYKQELLDEIYYRHGLLTTLGIKKNESYYWIRKN